MVDPYDELIDTYYKKELEQARAESAAISAKHSQEKDQEYAPLLRKIESVFGVRLKSFDDLPHIPLQILTGHLLDFIDVLNHETQKGARGYALRQILVGRDDLEFSVLFDMYTHLTPVVPGGNDYSQIRSHVAHYLQDKLTPHDFEQFLVLFDKKENFSDMNLLDGLLKIKDKKFDDRIIGILRAEVRRPGGVWAAARILRRKKYTSLLPELEAAKARATDLEIRREIEKTIESLKRFQEKQGK